MNSSEQSILIVEDEHITAMEVQGMLEEIGYSVADIVDTGSDALEVMEETPVDLIIMDIRLPGNMNGIEAANEINQSHNIPIVYFSAHSDDDTLEQARNTEPAGFLIKPITKEDLRTTVEVALSRHDAESGPE
jgi:CheY-like chemotaxis protein